MRKFFLKKIKINKQTSLKMVSIVLITYTAKLKAIFRGFKPLVTLVSPKQAKTFFQKKLRDFKQIKISLWRNSVTYGTPCHAIVHFIFWYQHVTYRTPCHTSGL